MRLERAVGYGALVGLLAILSLLAAACGNDDTAGPAPMTQAPETTPVTGATLDATAVVTTPGGPDDAEPAEEPLPTLAPTPEPTPEPTLEPKLEPMEGASPTPDAGTTIQVEVAGGKPVDGVQRHRVDPRDAVTIIVTGDTADELHIHGYDLVVPFSPGQPGTITFEAGIPGIFEVETHHHGDLVMELQVG